MTSFVPSILLISIAIILHPLCEAFTTFTKFKMHAKYNTLLHYTNHEKDTEQDKLISQMKMETEAMRLEAKQRIQVLSEKLSKIEVISKKVIAKKESKPIIHKEKKHAKIEESLLNSRIEKDLFLSRKKEESPKELSSGVIAHHKDDLELLDGTHWKIALDINREKGTWMPKTWGASGDHLRLNLVVCFDSAQLYEREEFLGSVAGAKVCRVINKECMIGPSMSEGSRNFKVNDGGYRICKGIGPLGTDLLRFYIEIEDQIQHTGSDVYCPAGKIYMTCGFFPMNKPASEGKKLNLRWKLRDLEDKCEHLQDAVDKEGFFSFQKLVLQRELFATTLEVTQHRRYLEEAHVTEPDTSLLRFSRRKDVALTKEGGVCCRVTKEAGRQEYHILGKFGTGCIGESDSDV